MISVARLERGGLGGRSTYHAVDEQRQDLGSRQVGICKHLSSTYIFVSSFKWFT
jgi:hypothetical protein